MGFSGNLEYTPFLSCGPLCWHHGAGGSVISMAVYIMSLSCGWRFLGGDSCCHRGLGQFWLVSFSHLDLLVLCLPLVVNGFLGGLVLANDSVLKLDCGDGCTAL